MFEVKKCSCALGDHNNHYGKVCGQAALAGNIVCKTCHEKVADENAMKQPLITADSPSGDSVKGQSQEDNNIEPSKRQIRLS